HDLAARQLADRVLGVARQAEPARQDRCSVEDVVERRLGVRVDLVHRRPSSVTTARLSNRMPIVTLTTDFGGADGYGGAMKGVILTLTPAATVVDIAHDVPRHDVAHAAWVLATSAFAFPLGTIHVCVVDPGVGGARNEVVVAARGHLFVGPDNGVFALV